MADDARDRFDLVSSRAVRWLTRQAWRGRLPWPFVDLTIDLIRGVQIARRLRGRS